MNINNYLDNYKKNQTTLNKLQNFFDYFCAYCGD